jgi:hypothetical protein
MTSVNDEYVSIPEDDDGLIDLGELEEDMDADYFIALTGDELQALGHACELMVDALTQLAEAVPAVVEQVAQMARDVQ